MELKRETDLINCIVARQKTMFGIEIKIILLIPCHACPMEDFELFPFNKECLDGFYCLNLTGRNIGFSEIGNLREEAIDCYLRRHEINYPDYYQTILKMMKL